MAAVVVADGGTSRAPTLGRFCGTETPGTVRSTGNSLYVNYFNNVPRPGNGFRARISLGDSFSFFLFSFLSFFCL